MLDERMNLELPRLPWEEGAMREIFAPELPDPDFALPGAWSPTCQTRSS